MEKDFETAQSELNKAINKISIKMKKKNKIRIVVTGGNGRFGKVLKNVKSPYDVHFPKKSK